jgi:uncharacterized membrane protein YcaP (DUF421 family)
VARLTAWEVTAINVIGVTAAVVSLNLVKSWSTAAAGLVVWTLMPIIVYLLSMKFKSVRNLIQGKETVVINHGMVLDDKLKQSMLTPEDLLSELRKNHIFQFADVEFAVLEPNGEVSTFLKKDKQPVTASTLGINPGNESVPQTVMIDGNIMDEPLTAMGLNRGWLHAELEKAGVAPENVFIAQVDSSGQIYLDLFDDSINIPQPKTKALAWSSLKKCQADMEMYALETRDLRSKETYQKAAEQLTRVIQDLQPYLKG